MAKKVFYTLGFAFLIFSFLYNHSKFTSLLKKLKSQHREIIFSQRTIAEKNENILRSLFAHQVFEIVKNLKSDEEKCMAVAKWVSGNISSQGNPKNSLYESFSTRSGLCGYRARLFVEMLQYLNIPAMVFNIYNYPAPGGGHSCAQAYYAGAWHFFDVTYAGCFKKGNDVLSFKQVMEEAKKGKLFEYLNVFEETLDKTGVVEFKSDNPEPIVTMRKCDNKQRMRYYYRNIQEAKTYGFFRHPAPKKLFINFDFNKRSKNYSIGNTAMDYLSFGKIGIQENLTENIGLIGTCTDNFQHQWNFNNLKPGCVYTMRLFTYRYNVPGDSPSKKLVSHKNFFAKTDAGATILEGEIYDSSLNVWTIKFKALQKQAHININYQKPGSSNTSCLLLNKITIDQETIA